MSELKAVHVVDVYDEYSADPYKEAQVYLKSEADREIRNQKRKRCLALAKWCKLEQERIELIENQDITDDDFDKLVKGFYTKWQNRWLAIADKFKEA